MTNLAPKENLANEEDVKSIDDSTQLSVGDGADLTSAETQVSKPKRRSRKRRRRNTETPEESTEEWAAEDSTVGDEANDLLHRPFHRVVFDEDGNPTDIVLRSASSEHTVNRKYQKRLATSNYNWGASEQQTEASAVSTKRRALAGPNSTTTVEFDEENEVWSKNLAVKRYRFPNDYDTTVSYWYTTLEWLDRAALGLVDQGTGETAGEHENAETEEWENEVEDEQEGFVNENPDFLSQVLNSLAGTIAASGSSTNLDGCDEGDKVNTAVGGGVNNLPHPGSLEAQPNSSDVKTNDCDDQESIVKVPDTQNEVLNSGDEVVAQADSSTALIGGNEANLEVQPSSSDGKMSIRSTNAEEYEEICIRESEER